MSWALLAALLGCGAPAPPEALPAPVAPQVAVDQALGYDAIYFALVDRFANGDPSNDGAVDPEDPQAFHGGDLAGVIEHLDALEAMGIRTVWLSPVFQMRTEKFMGHGAFHGYWVQDLGQVEPRFGTEAELVALSEALHARGMRLYLDMIFNHVSFDAPLAQEHPEWFHPALPIEDWDDPAQAMEREVHGLKDFDQSNPEVYQFLLERALHWVEVVQPDGFRIDAVRHMPLPFQAQIMEDLRQRSGRPLASLGEFFDGDPGRLSAAWVGGGFDSVFDFPLRYAMIDVFCHDRDVGRLAAVLSADGVYPDARRIATFLDNHDVSRVTTECGGDVERVGRAIDFLTAARGVPVIFQGTEVGQEGAGEPENRADMRFGEAHPLEARIRDSLARRRQHVALTEGHTRLVALEPGLLVFDRVSEDETARVAVNTGDSPRSFGGAQLPVGVSASWGPGEPWAAPPTREVVLRVSAAEGDRLVMTGTGPLLGHWGPSAGVPLAWGEGGWEAHLEVPEGTALEFKLVRMGPDREATWQDGDNRYLFVGPGAGPLEAAVAW
ncbi:MAG: hypothetical protein JXX28_03865 [Deltaproteobacteria bacterium]|nr:hypothetical protein [Deltaproteobacteria bacterium]